MAEEDLESRGAGRSGAQSRGGNDNGYGNGNGNYYSSSSSSYRVEDSETPKDLLVGPDVRVGEHRYVCCRHVRQRLFKRQQCLCHPGQVRRELSRLEKLGALEWSKVVHKHRGWRLVTCIWLHAGVIHLFVNMLSLVFIGIRLEQQFGFVRIGIIYLFPGFGGSGLSSLFIQNSISVGASGALFGHLGAMLSELLINWTICSNKAAALLTLLVIIIVNLGIGILPHVDNLAHIGGFLTGFLLGFVLLPRPRFGWWDQRINLPANVPLKSKYKPYQYVLWLLSVVLLTAGFVVALVMLFRGESGNDRCHWCHYLNCVPTSKWDCE